MIFRAFQTSLDVAAVWGGITGTLASQTDLQAALNLKAALISPSFTTPTLGVASATSINKVTLTAPASSAVLTILNGKTFTVNKTLTLDGTDGTTMTFPATSATLARTDAANTFTGVQTMTSANLITPALGVATATSLAVNGTLISELTTVSTATSVPRGIASAQFNTGGDSARFSGYKARGTQASPTTVVTADLVTRWSGFPHDGTGFLEMSSIVMGTEGTIATNRTPTYIAFQTATDAPPSVLTERWRINSAGHFLAGVDNTYDIGASGATRPRSAYVATSILVGVSTILFSSYLRSPQLIGGQGTASTLILQSTEGNAVSGADIIFKGGNNGATELARMLAGGTGIGEIGIGVSPTGNAGLLQGAESRTITGTVADGLAASHTFAPTYTAATAQTVTRHNYLRLTSPVLAGAGPAALTDACVAWFDAAAGTHKAVDAGTTKITVGGVDAWLKWNINGTIYYSQLYLSKTT